MTEVLQMKVGAPKKRRVEELDDDCRIISESPAKKTKTSSSFFQSMFIRIGDWFKSTRNRTGTTAGSLFGSLKESNSAADAIAHGGQYLADASTDKFMLRDTHPVGNGGSSERQASAGIPNRQLSQGVYMNGIGTSGWCHKTQAYSQSDQTQTRPAAPAFNLPGDHQKLPNQYNSQIAQFSASQQTFNNGPIPTASYNNTACERTNGCFETSNSDEGLNRTLQTSYVQQTPTRVQASVYDRKYDTLEVGNASSYVTSRSSTRKKTTIERCYDLEEKARYKKLLENFSLSNLPSTGEKAQRFAKYLSAAYPEQKDTTLKKQLFSDKTVASVCLDESIKNRSDLDQSVSSCTSSVSPVKASSPAVKRPPLHTPNYVQRQTPPIEVIKPSKVAQQCDELMKRMQGLKERSVERLELQKRLVAEERKLAEWDKLREEEDLHLEKMVQQRLRLSAKVILDDLPVEPVQDEFPELTDEANMVVAKALSQGPDNILSDAFRIKIKRTDIHTLAGLNWLNDEIINFYFNLIQARSENEGMPKVYVFNTFFYPTVMKRGHAGVKRWTRQVDIFSKDILLAPVHMGVHWCLASIDFRSKNITYYDSMGSNNNACLVGLKLYLEEESLDKKKQSYDTSDWCLENRKDIPQQMNGSDCGVFACKFAEYISRDADITFTQENMPYFRRRMVYEIIMKRLL